MKITQLHRSTLAAVFMIVTPAWTDPVDQIGPIDCGSTGTLVSNSPVGGASEDAIAGIEKFLVKVTVPSSIPDPDFPKKKLIPCPVKVIHYTSQADNQVPGITTLFQIDPGFSSSAPVYLEPKPPIPPNTGPTFPGYVGFECQEAGVYCQFSYTATPMAN
jgi:hypothetical protein